MLYKTGSIINTANRQIHMYYHLYTVVDYIVRYNIIQRRGTMISAISVVLKFAIFQNMETTTTSIEKTVTKLILNYSLNAIPGSFYVWA